MWRAICRLGELDTILGYIVEDENNSRHIISKLDFWKLAKRGLVHNCVSMGNEENPIVSGINGFKLRELPLKKKGSRSFTPDSTKTVGVKILTKLQFHDFGKMVINDPNNMATTGAIVGYEIVNTGIPNIPFMKINETKILSIEDVSNTKVAKFLKEHLLNGKLVEFPDKDYGKPMYRLDCKDVPTKQVGHIVNGHWELKPEYSGLLHIVGRMDKRVF